MTESATSETTTTPTYTKDENLWFDDGSIILISAEPNRRGFCVYRGLLARRADFFKDLSENASPDCSSVGAAQELELDDTADHIEHFLNYIFDPRYFTPMAQKTPLPVLYALLRMATKYLHQELRTAVVMHLHTIYPSTATPPAPKSFVDNRPNQAPGDSIDPLLYALRMGRECDVPRILPAAFYLAIQGDIMDCVRLAEKFSSDDASRLLRGREKFIAAATRAAMHESLPSPIPVTSYTSFGSSHMCRKYAEATDTRWASDLDVKEIFLGALYGKKRKASATLCTACIQKWEEDESAAFAQLWVSLPGIFELAGWESYTT
ncbi:hypothetical protein CYLTODRAFT_494636 [Cylindrobasidium torrendii FP15055 ss-10]|uniref:BTB domain-containing protein n=1 Tax=Cylindrobasidium torrendii FP15055 ss-10 TaxID=1314674 RepID=A0A0D7AVM6_9AGAR|nr:hypothetical protein CYLTODRAFT_494636 [Cylindrobasidium torrendii FP15055 ss-10]